MTLTEQEKNTETIEDIILRFSERGISEIRQYSSEDCCHKAAAEIMSWEKGTVFLTTGFYVAGYAETDGPVGTMVLAKALQKLGYTPVILTDQYCLGFFELEEIKTEYVKFDAGEQEFSQLMNNYKPVGMISIERCGKNRFGECANMRGISITENTARIDELFARYQGSVPTIGVGDGGNEIGMGKIAGVIQRKLSLEPCVVSTDLLVLASVSNWGAYGITAALGKLNKQDLLPSFAWVEKYIGKTVEIGSVDGVTHEKKISVDGKDMKTEEIIITALRETEI